MLRTTACSRCSNTMLSELNVSSAIKKALRISHTLSGWRINKNDEPELELKWLHSPLWETV